MSAQPHDPTSVSQTLAYAVTAIVFTNYLLDTFLDVAGSGSSKTALLGASAALLAIGYLQLGVFSRPGVNLASRPALLALAVMAALVYGPVLFLPGVWDGMHGFLAGSALLVLRGAARWAAYAGVALSNGLAHAMSADQYSVQAYYTVAALVSGLVVYGLSRLPSQVRRLESVRAELAVFTVEEERLRFADAVSERIGNSLIEVLPRATRIARSAHADPAAAQRDAAEIVDISREASSAVRAVAASYRAPLAPGQSPTAHPVTKGRPVGDEGRAVRSASVLFTMVVLGYGVMSTTQVAFDYPRIGANGMVVATLATAFELALVLGVVCAPRRHVTRGRAALTLAAMAVCVYVPVLTLGNPLVAVPGFLAGAAALLLRPRIGWPFFVLVVVGQWFAWTWCGFTGSWVVYGLVAATNHGLILYALARLRSMTLALHDAREELATSAVLRERARLARDLHDLLGFSLSAVTLKSELARKLLDTDFDRARAEMDEVAEIARLALAETRTVALTRPDLSLGSALRSAQALLRAGGVTLELTVEAPCALPKDVDTVLALVLREAVTNVLRHSCARRCELVLVVGEHEVRMELLNDGAGPLRSADTGGSGTDNLTARVQALGGVLQVGRPSGTTYRLMVRLPLSTA